MRPILIAFGFLTRIPMPRVRADPAHFAAAIRAYPLVGLVIGAFVAGAGWAGAQVDPWMGALAALVAWVLVTGGLHLDGLSDLADGCGAAHRDRDRLIAVMSDPHVGSFGVIAIVVQLLAKLVLLHGMIGADWLGLTLVPFAARIGPLVWARYLAPLKPGLGAAVAGAVRYRDIVGWVALLLAGAVLVPAMLATPFLVIAWAIWLRHRIGGVSGDCHGAGIELVETGLLCALVIAGQR